uniref:Ubiquitin n=1 Tax=Solanum tuberosum TaxID=4113 RepID=M1DVE8_SOLTU
MFIATRTKTGKEIQTDSKVAIAELQNCQNSGETTDDVFRAVFGKEQPGQLRCYGRSVTTSSLKEDEETNKLKQKHANEINSLKEEMNEMREEM